MNKFYIIKEIAIYDNQYVFLIIIEKYQCWAEALITLQGVIEFNVTT